MDGSAAGELIGIIIKYALLTFSFVGVYRWIQTRKDGKRHLQTKILTIICVLLSLYLFLGKYIDN